MDDLLEHLAEKWARNIAEAYSEQANPRLAPEAQKRLAGELARRLSDPLATKQEWPIRANLALNAWERREGGEGPRVLSLDMANSSVEMGRLAFQKPT